MLEEPRNTVEGRVIRRASPAGMRTRAVRVEPPRINRHEVGTRVAVVYYLCRNRLLEHPHLMEVPLASPQDGLYLRDVMSRLDALRGKGMAAMYSWSCKRRYKNGFVWHDLSQDDLLLPSQGTEYVLKGSELLHDQSRLLLPQYHDHNIGGTSNAKVQCPMPTEQQESSPPSPGSQRGWNSSLSPPPPRTGSAVLVTKEEAAAPVQLAFPSSSTFAPTITDEKRCRTPPHACSSDSSSPKTTSMASSGASSPQLNNPVVAPRDATTQPDESVKDESRSKQPESAAADAGEYSCTGRSGSLKSMIRAEAASRKGVVMVEEGKTATSSSSMSSSGSGRLKPTNLLMRLMACGPNHPAGLGNKARFLSQLEFPPSSPELTPGATTASAVTVRASSETEHPASDESVTQASLNCSV